MTHRVAHQFGRVATVSALVPLVAACAANGANGTATQSTASAPATPTTYNPRFDRSVFHPCGDRPEGVAPKLKEVAVYEGRPAQSVALKPQFLAGSGGGGANIYQFEDRGTERWARCSYDNGSVKDVLIEYRPTHCSAAHRLHGLHSFACFFPGSAAGAS